MKWFKPKSPSLYKIETGPLREADLKAWLMDPNTLKFVKLLKILKQTKMEFLIENPTDKDIAIGFCQGYQSIINILENTIASAHSDGNLSEERLKEITKSNVEELLETFNKQND